MKNCFLIMLKKKKFPYTNTQRYHGYDYCQNKALTKAAAQVIQ